LMASLIDELQQSEIAWRASRESPYMFQAVFKGEDILVRLNDFPDEPLCTIIIRGTETDVHDFPKCWTLPRHRGEKP